MGFAIGAHGHRGLPRLRAGADADHADRAGWPLGDQGGADHRLLHAPEIRALQPLSDAFPDADLLHSPDADLPRRRNPYSRNETAVMRRAFAMSVLWTALALSAEAQCVMCYRTAHAQQAARSRVLNMGILIL